MIRLVVEKDHFLQVVRVVLDPSTPQDCCLAWDDFFSHDVADFPAWCRQMRARVPGLFPASVAFAGDQAELRRLIADAGGVIVEGLRVGEEELAAGRRLSFVQRFGHVASTIDVAACVRRSVSVEVLRRRVNIAVAEQAFMLMLALAKRVCTLNKLVAEADLAAAGHTLRPYDRRYCGGSNFARFAGIPTLNGAVLGVVGMGEVGREIAVRAAAFGMEVLYFQRRRIDASEEWPSRASYCALAELAARADYLSVNLPLNASTRGIIDASVFERMKPGAVLVNVARAELIDRDALMRALCGGRLGGLGLDVGYEEPARADEPLLKHANVIYMPHTAIADRKYALMDLEEMFLKMWRALNRALA